MNQNKLIEENRLHAHAQERWRSLEVTEKHCSDYEYLSYF
jgi:hypothetical protein